MTLEEARNLHLAEKYFAACQGDEQEYYDIFFAMCRKYGIVWSEASESVRKMISEITRIEYERKKALESSDPKTHNSISPAVDLQAQEKQKTGHAHSMQKRNSGVGWKTRHCIYSFNGLIPLRK